MMRDRNEGIVNRGTISGHAIAVGHRARAVATIESSTSALENMGHNDIAQRLDELKEQMLAHSTSIDGFEEAIDALELVATELAAPKPNRVTIRGLLEGLSNSLRSVSGVAQATAALKTAVEVLL